MFYLFLTVESFYRKCVAIYVYLLIKNNVSGRTYLMHNSNSM